MRLTTIILIVLALQPASALRQAPAEGEIGGYITVKQGHSVAVLPGATVTVVRGDHRYVAITDGRGQFAIRSLQPGTYSVTVELVGFVPATGSVTLRPVMRAHLTWSLGLACLDAVQRVVFDVQHAVTVADAVVHFRVASESDPVLWSGHPACAGAVNREYRAELLDGASRQREVERHFYPLGILKADDRFRLHAGEEYLAYVVWQPNGNRFTFLGPELVFPIRDSRVDAAGAGELNGLYVNEALEIVRRWVAEWRRGSDIGEVPADFGIRMAAKGCRGR